MDNLGHHPDVGAAENASVLTKQEQEPLMKVSKMYIQSQSVEYAPCGKAFATAVEHAGIPEVEMFMQDCLDGVISIFLEQTAQSVQVKLLRNFNIVLQGACKLILHDLRKYHHVKYLVTLAKLFGPDCVFYSTPDPGDPHTDILGKPSLNSSRGWKVREAVVNTFREYGGFDILEQMMIGDIPVNGLSVSGETNAAPVHNLGSATAAGATAAISLEESQSQTRSLSAAEVSVLLEPFVLSRDLIGIDRAEAACRAAMKAVERMDEEALKSQRTIELVRLRKSLKIVLGNDERLRSFLRALALKTFTSRAFQLRKLGLDLIGELVSDAQQATSQASLEAPHRTADQRLNAPKIFDVESMNAWLVNHEVLEKLFGSTDALHPALVGRSQRLLEFMARGGAMQEKHVDLMFKCCVGHHDSVRGAVQSLLAELAVDHNVYAGTAAYILRCASRLVDEHRGDMLFFVEKLMSSGTASTSYQLNLSLCDVTVLNAVLDLLWRLLETTTDLNSPRRKQLVDFIVEVLRMNNARMLRARYIVIYIDILSASAQRTPDSGPESPSEAVRISTAYELLQKILLMFDILQVNSASPPLTGGSLGSSSGGFDSARNYVAGNIHTGGRTFQELSSLSVSDSLQGSDSEDYSLILTEGADGTRQLRTQSALIIELEDRYKLLELVVEEIKTHCTRTQTSEKATREQLLTHMQTLQIRLDFLQYCVSRSSLMLNFELVHQLWESLSQPLEREICMVWLRQVAVVDNGLRSGLSAIVTRQVFSQLLCGDMEFKQLSEPGFKCFSAFFLDVNRAENVLDGEVVNHGTSVDASAEATSTTILDTHVQAADEEENSNKMPISSSVSPHNGSGPTLSLKKSKNLKQKPPRGKRHRSSVFTEFAPLTPRASWDNRVAPMTGAGGSETTLLRKSSSSLALSPTNALPSPTNRSKGNRMPTFVASSAPIGSSNLGSDIRISVVRDPNVVGIDTLWRIVESAPEVTAVRAMDLLLQVQCRLETLEDTLPASGDDLDAGYPVTGMMEPDDHLVPEITSPNNLGIIGIGGKTGLQRRREFLDRTFALLEQSAVTNNAGTAKVQRCIRLITSYLHHFPQTARLIPHAPPRGAELSLEIHHDKVLLFSKHDIGKVLQLAVPITVSPQMRRGQTPRYLQGLIVNFDPKTCEHVIWFINGSKEKRNMTSMHILDHGIKTSAENTYQMMSRAILDTDDRLLQPAPGVLTDDEVEKASRAYRPLYLNVREKCTLGALHQMILDQLVYKDQSYCPLDQRTISLSALVYHKSQRSLSHNQQHNQFSGRSMDFGHERVLMGVQETLDEILPPADQAAGVEKTTTSHVIRHTINIDIDVAADLNSPISEVDEDSELPAKLITAEGSKYVSMIMKLLDDPVISDTTRVELWELLQRLPTDEGLLRRLTESSDEVDWSSELRPNGPFMLRAVYALMIVNRLIGNQESRASYDTQSQDDNISSPSDDGEASIESSAWRSSFLKTGGFQDVVLLLGRILVESSDPSNAEYNWFWAWQQTVALPVIMRIVRFCVRGSLSDSTNDTVHGEASILSRIEQIQMEESKQARGMAFSPASKETIARSSDLQTLAKNLSVLIVLAHRTTCSQSGFTEYDTDDEDDDLIDEDKDHLVSKNDNDVPIPSGLVESDGDDSDSEDDDADDTTDSAAPLGYSDDDYGLSLDRSGDSSSGQRDDAINDSDDAMLNVLVDAVQTSFMLLQADKSLGSDFLSSQAEQQRLNQDSWIGAKSIVDVLSLSRFPIVREMLRDLLSMLCTFSQENLRTVEALARETIYTTPKNCPTCDDYFAFVRTQIAERHFRVESFTRIIIARLVQYPALTRQQIRREARLLSPFNIALRSQCFKLRPGKVRRPTQNEDTAQYNAIKTVTLKLLDDTLIGYLDLMELILQKNPAICQDDSMCTPLMESLFHRFLMAVPTPNKKRASAIASLPDIRTRAFGLLRLMAEADNICLKWLSEATHKFVLDTPVPVNRQGRLDWNFKPVDSRKSPSGFVGLVNQGATCYQNSVLQQLFMAPQLRDWILHSPGVLGSIVSSNKAASPSQNMYDNDLEGDGEDGGAEYLWNNIPGMRDHKKNRLLRALQYTFTFLKNSDKRYFNPRGFVDESAALKLMDGHLSQNDAIEFYSRLVDYLEDTTQGRMQCKALQDMLYVRTCTMNVRNCEGKHRTESEVGTPFLTLNVRSGMAGPTLHSLDDALESWFKAEKLSGLECEVCNAMDKERRFEADQIKCFSKLPPVLVVQLQRFDFDYEIMQPTKLNHRVSFEHRIDLYRFTRAAVMEKFDEEARQSQSATVEPNEPNSAHAVSDASGLGNEAVAVSAGRSSPMMPHDNEREESLGEPQSECHEDDSLNKSNTEYELCGVVVHQGSGANFGHYYSFIKDRRSGAWFRFDDERVTPFDVRNLEEECFGGPLNNGGAQAGWSSGGNSSIGMTNMGMGGMGKFKQYGARDNNAYLLLYELVNGPKTIGGTVPREPKLAMPRGLPQPLAEGSVSTLVASASDVYSEQGLCSLSFAQVGKIVCKMQVWIRQARLALTAKHRLEGIEQDVWEDNQRTMRHGLVMVPTFMDFCYQLLLISSHDKDTFESTLKMALVVYTRATMRIYTQKPRLRMWDIAIRGALQKSLEIGPDVVPWFLSTLTESTGRHDSLEPLLLRCSEKTARGVIIHLMEEVIKLATTAISSPADYLSDAFKLQLESILSQFVDVMCEMMPLDIPPSYRFLRPYFAVWRMLCRVDYLRDSLLQRDVPALLLRVYQIAESATRQSNRHRGGSMDQGHPQANGGPNDGDLTALVDSLSLLLTGKTTEDSYSKLMRRSGYFEDPLASVDDEDDEDDLEEQDEAGSGFLVTANGEVDPRASTLDWFLRQARHSSALRFARGTPACQVAQNNATILPENFVLLIARRDPRPGAVLLAHACKGDIELSRHVITSLHQQLENTVGLVDVANATVEAIRHKIKSLCLALGMLGSIEDGHSIERSQDLVGKCLNQVILLSKEAKTLAARQEQQRAGGRYPQNMYYDPETEEMYQINVYAAYSLAKMLGQLFHVNSGVRSWMVEYSPHWVPWLPNWLDTHSYDRCLGGNLDVFTRTIAKGRTVRLLARAAAMANPDICFRPIVPQKVSILVKGAATPECNGSFSFDGYFKPNESNQIDSVTPKFVKFVESRPYNLYRCQVKDKQYTWYISELSAKPGTNSDTDYYSSHHGNPSTMPPESGWVACGQGAKPAPSHARIIREPFDPVNNPCEAMEKRAAKEQMLQQQQQQQDTVAANRVAGSSLVAANQQAGQQNSAGSAQSHQGGVMQAIQGAPPQAPLPRSRAEVGYDAGAEGDDEGGDEEDEGDDDLPTGTETLGYMDEDDAASDQAVNPGGSVGDDYDGRDNLSTASGSGSEVLDQEPQDDILPSP